MITGFYYTHAYITNIIQEEVMKLKGWVLTKSWRKGDVEVM